MYVGDVGVVVDLRTRGMMNEQHCVWVGLSIAGWTPRSMHFDLREGVKGSGSGCGSVEEAERGGAQKSVGAQDVVCGTPNAGMHNTSMW